jgi:hypothetical protein
MASTPKPSRPPSRCPEAEIVADDQMAHTEAAHQHVLDEAVGMHRGEGGIEAAHMHTVDAVLRQLEQLVTQRGQARRRVLRREVLTRVWLEGQYGGFRVARTGLLDEHREQGLMAAVNAVEVADGEHRGPRGALRNPSKNLHKRLKKAAIIPGSKRL